LDLGAVCGRMLSSEPVDWIPVLMSEVNFVLSYISNCGVTVVAADFGVCLLSGLRMYPLYLEP
jgi:hypothetical protein